ncbi:MAG: iron ABC transporter permease [Bosea sp. (in: a-proteobacteria)]|uniref:ABC transporter permease n=1 Tax=Bosea sp. (in: a-proteobacteria) TaxID=1871050 RepID=UPI000B0E054A|nr:iron ABC transporter permease [Bosea sp. (in: a-proteobacteria)]MDP3600016.1 iron ABC transporter permease [Bosea sp. (in: a-proteobacteria)]WRH57745.1 MAG: iron ABC transporter permease [Bosea sp. (in: a-proteobacteria)]
MTLAAHPGWQAARPRPSWRGLALPGGLGLPLLVTLCAILLGGLPFLRLAAAAFAPGWQFSPEAALAEIGSRAAVNATLHTLETAGLSAIGALLIGGSAAILLAVTDVRGKRMIAFALVFSMMIAPQVAALAFLSLLAPHSPILAFIGLSPAPGTPNPLLGRGGIALVMALHHAPLVAITLWTGLRSVPHSLIEAAQMEGAGPATIIGRILLPVLRPQIIAAALLAFVAGVGNFGIPALLGLPVNYLTLPTLIYRRLSSFGPAGLPDAAALSILVALVAAVGIAAGMLATRRAGGKVEIERPLEPFWTLGRARPIVLGGLLLLLTIKLGLPFLALLAEALTPALGVALSWQSLTFDKFAEVLLRQDVTVRAFRNSFLFAGSAAVILALAAIAFAYALERRMGRARRVVEAVIELPYALPGVVLAIACILMFLKPLPLLGVSIYATPFIILFAYLARFLPLALKAPLAAMAQIEAHHEEAAKLDGVTLWQMLRFIVAPILAPAAMVSALMVFLVAFNELTVSALLWSSGTETLGVVLFSLKEAGLAGEAAAVAISASGVILAAMLVLDLLAKRLPGNVLPWRI